jgi:diguanylate cyclase (GGDEF)-like protein
MKISFLKTRFVGYLLLLAVIGWFLFNFLMTSQSAIMYKYFIEKPSNYNLERAERLASSIYKSFKAEITAPSAKNIREFINKYNDIPFLSVNFIYQDSDGNMQSIIEDVKEIDILGAEYVYPIKHGSREVGTLLVYDINREYKRGLEEYNHMMSITRGFFAVLLFLLLSVMIFREYSSKIWEEKQIAQYQAVHDGLTGLYTQKYFKKHLEREIDRCKRYKRPISLIMCDVDYFKKFNDTYGHLAGDNALQTVAGIISSSVRASDIVARYGGEEFAILLMEAGMDEIKSIAKRLKALTEETLEIAARIKGEVAKASISVDHSFTHVTISMGVASYDGETEYKPEYLISAADSALYESKRNGRNCITLFHPDTKEFEVFASS